MSYSPTLDRWIQQDGYGLTSEQQYGADGLRAERRAHARAVERFGEAASANLALWAYTDGSDRYEALSENPTNALDPSGRDRYVIDGGGGHHGIAVDTWTLVNGKWVNTGTVQYDFAADYGFGPLILGAGIGCPDALAGLHQEFPAQ